MRINENLIVAQNSTDLSDSDGGIDENIDISGTADNDVHLEQQDELEINKSDVAPILRGQLIMSHRMPPTKALKMNLFRYLGFT